MKTVMNAAATPRLPLKTSFAALLPLSLCLPLHAQVSQPAIPNAGSILQQVQPALPAAPQENRPALQVQPGDIPAAPASVPFQVNLIRIVGNTAFTTGTLRALVAGAEGRSVTLAELEQHAARITAWYQQHGFPLSRAIVPAQTIKDGEVVIQVVEARYGAVRLNNGSRVDDALLSATLNRLQPGRAIAERDLDRALLLLSDVPGVAVDAVIKPGAAVGAADLEVATRRSPATVASLVLDNAGNRYIGRARLGATAYLTNPLRHGDVFDAGIISTGHGMDYGRVGYETLLGGAGTRAGAAYSSVHYKLQDDVAALDAYGRAGVAGAWIKQPLLRGRASNLYLQGAYDTKRLRDRIGATATRTDRRLDNWMLSLNGDLRDGLLGGGVNAWSLGWTRGRTRFEDADAELADAASAHTRGRFSKWNLNASRLQRLGARDALYLNLGAQWANTNLDSAEKMTVGGPYTVRAYDSGALSGDTGYVASVELRHELGAFAGNWQAIVFADSARIRINRDAWTASTNTARLSGAGLGLTWSGPSAWRASLSVAAPIGAEPALLGRQRSTRAWATLGKGF
jgi:hemolysin activation/secretion protein